MGNINISSLLTAFRYADSDEKQTELIEALMGYEVELLKSNSRAIKRTLRSAMFGSNPELIFKSAALHKAADCHIEVPDAIPTLLNHFEDGDQSHKLATLQALKVFTTDALEKHELDVVEAAEDAFNIDEATLQEEAAAVIHKLGHQVVRIGGRPVSVGL